MTTRCPPQAYKDALVAPRSRHSEGHAFLAFMAPFWGVPGHHSAMELPCFACTELQLGAHMLLPCVLLRRYMLFYMALLCVSTARRISTQTMKCTCSPLHSVDGLAFGGAFLWAFLPRVARRHATNGMDTVSVSELQRALLVAYTDRPELFLMQVAEHLGPGRGSSWCCSHIHMRVLLKALAVGRHHMAVGAAASWLLQRAQRMIHERAHCGAQVGTGSLTLRDYGLRDAMNPEGGTQRGDEAVEAIRAGSTDDAKTPATWWSSSASRASSASWRCPKCVIASESPCQHRVGNMATLGVLIALASAVLVFGEPRIDLERVSATPHFHWSHAKGGQA